MTVARISIMRPSPGKKAEVERLLDSMEDSLSSQPGYVMGFRFGGLDDDERVGRISLWSSHGEADHAATLTHTLALRSRIHVLIEPGHLETLVEIKGSPKNIPGPRSG